MDTQATASSTLRNESLCFGDYFITRPTSPASSTSADDSTVASMSAALDVDDFDYLLNRCETLDTTSYPAESFFFSYPLPEIFYDFDTAELIAEAVELDQLYCLSLSLFPLTSSYSLTTFNLDFEDCDMTFEERLSRLEVNMDLFENALDSSDSFLEDSFSDVEAELERLGCV